MILSIFKVLIPLVLLLLVIVALPMIITLVYRFFYNNHVNRIFASGCSYNATGCTGTANYPDESDDSDETNDSNDSDDSDEAYEVDDTVMLRQKSSNTHSNKSVHRWMPPFSVFLITLFAEILLYMALGMVFKFNTSEGVDQYPDAGLSATYETLSQEEVDDSLFYKYFDGSDVQGYERSEQSDGDINCVIYTNESDSLLPQYILRLTYTGSEDIHTWDDAQSTDDESAGTMGEMETDSNAIYAVISGQILNYDDTVFTLNLYKESFEEVSDGFGTYDMGEPAASITVDFP